MAPGLGLAYHSPQVLILPRSAAQFPLGEPSFASAKLQNSTRRKTRFSDLHEHVSDLHVLAAKFAGVATVQLPSRHRQRTTRGPILSFLRDSGSLSRWMKTRGRKQLPTDGADALFQRKAGNDLLQHVVVAP